MAKFAKDVLICIALAIIAILGWFIIGFNPFTGKDVTNKELLWGITLDHIWWTLIIIFILWSAWVLFAYLKSWKEGYYQ